MPIAILRSYIQQILPHSSMTQVNTLHIPSHYNSLPLFFHFLLLSRQVSLFDQHDQLLNDSHLLRSLTTTPPSSSNRTTTDNMIQHVPIRFTLLNTVTSLSHCTCSNEQSTNSLFQPSSSNVNVIKQESINQTLSTCPLIPPTISTSTSTSSSPSKLMNNELSSSIAVSIVNLLTPPSSTVSSSAGPSSSSSSCHSSYRIENTVEPNQSIIDEITSKFGEICPPLPMSSSSSSSRKKTRNRLSKKMMMSLSSNMPLDLSLKKRPLPSSFDIYSSQAKWIRT